ncbi:hypothetical protein ZIOFF_048497 [Zingiber officinale]|uniref:DUF7798 domain-containing protein n=2 Tax=Zingiber officinale TaxID=94328 RepID=A0A8J5G7U8_ZINOF|nr:hypothetical protein ZIOFF_048497 [Zingiber officinale]
MGTAIIHAASRCALDPIWRVRLGRRRSKPYQMEDGGSEIPLKSQEEKPQGGVSGGWGGWGISSFSMFSDLQQAAQEISRNAVEAMKSATQGIGEVEGPDSDSETAGEVAKERAGENAGATKEKEESENARLRQSALEKLEKASEDSVFGQGLKVFDSSMETFASGAWSALGNALRGGSSLVSRLEHSAAGLADSFQQGDFPSKATSLAPSIIETGKTFTTKGIQVLERVGKETIELLMTETGFDVDKDADKADKDDDEEQFEEVTFDRCFYIYGGPDLLEELEALSSHHAMLFNRRRIKLSAEEKSFYDDKLVQIQQIFSLGTVVEENETDSNKGKYIEASASDSDVEMKKLCEASIRRAAEIASGFASALGGLAANDIIQRATDRLETVNSECIHRLSELCCSAVSHMLVLGKSLISNANKAKTEEVDDDTLKIEWPEDSVSKAKIIRHKVQSMAGDMDTVSSSFITGISDILEAYLAAIQSVSSEKPGLVQSSMQEKAKAITNHLRDDKTSAAEKVQDALHYLSYVVLSTSMPIV